MSNAQWTTDFLKRVIVYVLLYVILVENNIVLTSGESCNGNAEPSRALGGLQAIIDTASVSINEMLQLAKQRVSDLDKLCVGNGKEKIDTDLPFPSSCIKVQKSQKWLFRDCAEAYKKGNTKSGVYEIIPKFLDTPIQVYCDMTTLGGGWTVIQRRDADVSPRQNFFLDWNEYKTGFGNLSQEFWLGNDYIFALTNQVHTLLRIEMEDFENNSKFAQYTNFLVRSELEKYRITIGTYNGNAGDGFNTHNNSAFSTKDQDNDTWENHCAQTYKGGWWYAKCHYSNLNGLPHRGNHSTYADGINWGPFKGNHESMKKTEMKIRRIGYTINEQ